VPPATAFAGARGHARASRPGQLLCDHVVAARAVEDEPGACAVHRRSETHGRDAACGRRVDVSTLLLLSNTPRAEAEVLPALGLLLHHVRVAPAQLPTVLQGTPADAVLVDARRDLVAARALCRLLRAAALGAPLLLVVTEGGLAAVTADWGCDDVVLESAGPGEIEARLRLAAGRAAGTPGTEQDNQIRNGDLVIDDASYTAHVGPRPLDLTFKEFELLKFLAQHPGRVFTRAHLLQEVWGFDFFGGTRTVDVHVRRLRAKLSVEYEHLIGTVRNVGYRFVADPGAWRVADDTDNDTYTDTDVDVDADGASEAGERSGADTDADASVIDVDGGSRGPGRPVGAAGDPAAAVGRGDRPTRLPVHPADGGAPAPGRDPGRDTDRDIDLGTDRGLERGGPGHHRGAPAGAGRAAR